MPVGRRLEHDPDIVVIADGRQQGESRPHVRSPPQREFPDHDLVVEPSGRKTLGIDPVPGHQFGRLAGERVRLVWIRRAGGLVEQLAHPFEDRSVVLGVGRVGRRIDHHTGKVGDDRGKSVAR